MSKTIEIFLLAHLILSTYTQPVEQTNQETKIELATNVDSKVTNSAVKSNDGEVLETAESYYGGGGRCCGGGYHRPRYGGGYGKIGILIGISISGGGYGGYGGHRGGGYGRCCGGGGYGKWKG